MPAQTKTTKPKTVSMELQQPHIHQRVMRQKGDVIEVSERQAQFLESAQVAKPTNSSTASATV